MGEIYVNGKKKSNIYVNAKEFTEEYYKSVEISTPTDKLISMFSKIAKHFCTTYNYKNKCDQNACVNFAVSEAWLKWNKFNPEVSDNIFSFFTTMISNDLKLHYKLITRGKEVNISIEALFSGNKE